MRSFLPRGLSWAAAAIFAASAAQIAWTATLPGFAPVPYETLPAPNGQYVMHGGGDGRIPGLELAVYLGGALLVLALGTLAVLVLITRRRQLEALAEEDNNVLPTIAMNRLLCTVATISSGLAAIAGNHAARQDPAGDTENWFNPAGVANLAVLLVMWWWAPPKLPSGPPTSRQGGRAKPQPATRLSVSVGAAMGLAALLPVVASLLIPGAISRHPALFVGLAAAAILTVVALGEVLLHRNYGQAGQPRRWPRQPVSPALLTTGIVSVGLLLVVTILVAVRQAEAGVQPTWQATAWASAVTAAIAGIPLALARRRRSIPATVPGLDAALRVITSHRVVRTVAASCMVQAGALLMSAGRTLQAVYPPGPGPWDDAWQAAPAAGVLLSAAGVVIAVIPVRAVVAKRADKTAHMPEPVP